MVATRLSFTSSPSKKAGMFSVRPIFTGSTDIKKPQWARVLYFFPKVLYLINYFVKQFLFEIDLGYVKPIKVTAPDGTIPIKPSM